jgi:uncharacterized protein YhbP (UPF0306 family)
MELSGKDKKEILNFLSKHKLMSLGTYHKTPWSAWVYYLFDDDLNIYFVTNPKTKHGQNIAKNPKVSIAITDTSQDPKGNKVGFQAKGVVGRLNNLKEIPSLVKAWNKRGFVPMTVKLITKAWKSRFYKINLQEVQLFDENQPEEKEVRNWKI